MADNQENNSSRPPVIPNFYRIGNRRIRLNFIREYGVTDAILCTHKNSENFSVANEKIVSENVRCLEIYTNAPHGSYFFVEKFDAEEGYRYYIKTEFNRPRYVEFLENLDEVVAYLDNWLL